MPARSSEARGPERDPPQRGRGETMRRILRAYPTLLRIGFAEAVAYRAEMVVWMLTTTMPLVMLALWTAVAQGGQFGRFGQADFVAYYLSALIVRTLTSCWVVWEMNQEIRSGSLSMRLLRPIHPFLAYSAQHIAALPLRAAIAVPVAVILLIATGGSRVTHDPVVLAILPFTIAGAWLITFTAMTILGSLAMVIACDEVGINLGDFLGDEAELRDAIGIDVGLVLKSHGPKREQDIACVVHAVDVLFEFGGRSEGAELAGGIDVYLDATGGGRAGDSGDERTGLL